MNFTDIKIYALNGSSLMLSFTNIDAVLKNNTFKCFNRIHFTKMVFNE